MRTIEDHKVNPANDKLEILVMDAPGAGNASHEYVIDGPGFGCKDFVSEWAYQ